MSLQKLPIKRLVPAEDGANAKQRKVRKGTISCWECKRRKTRCVWSGMTDSVCDGCTRRGTQCKSQEFAEDPSSRKQLLGDRLGRVESLVNGLINNANINSYTAQELVSQTDEESIPQRFQDTDKDQEATVDNPEQSEPTKDCCHRALTAKQAFPLQPQCSTIIPPILAKSEKEHDLIKALLMAWPSPADLEIILSAPIRTSNLYPGLIFMPERYFLSEGLPSIHTLLRMPPQIGSNPVCLARALLSLAILLQTANPSIIQDLTKRLHILPQDLMVRAVETARRLVTSNDDIITTVEGIECIMMESRYYDNAGNLRRAYLLIRRALTVAQMIGLDRGTESPLIKFLDNETRNRINPSYMWFNIVQSDRYLSLMLGLPPGSYDESFAAPSVMATCTPIERMQRNLALAAGRMFKRAHLDLHATQGIDALLLENATLLPPQWWLPPEFNPDAEEMQELHDTLRLTYQLANFHLVQRLHLPYLLHATPTNSPYDYSKTAAITASRELLSRYTSLRCMQPHPGSFCRGVELLGFIACTALCLGHIDLRLLRDRQSRQSQDMEAGGALFGCLAHQRLSDRGLMERMLQSMERMARDDPEDVIAVRIAGVLRNLLDIETDIANGVMYRRDLSTSSESEELMCSGRMDGKGAVLSISIPHLGTIKFERDGISRAVDEAQGEESNVSINALGAAEVELDILGVDVQDNTWLYPTSNAGEEWAYQGVELNFFDTLFPINDAQDDP